MWNRVETGAMPCPAALWAWAALPRLLDWVGRSTLPEDWEQLMADKLPAWAAWFFSTSPWVPAILAALLTGWMMWISRPRKADALTVQEAHSAVQPPI